LEWPNIAVIDFQIDFQFPIMFHLDVRIFEYVWRGKFVCITQIVKPVFHFKRTAPKPGCDNLRTNIPEVRQNYGLVLLCF
jgi:hypothetical protein